MPSPAQPDFEAGRVYRTSDLARWGANPTRLAKRLVHEGQLRQLRHGLFYSPKKSRFGDVPPDDAAILRAFLGDDDFLFTGPPRWNALGLGSTAAFAVSLVYNTKRSAEYKFGGRRFQLRRVRFPRPAPPEWFALDLIEHRDMAGISLADVAAGLTRALVEGRLDRETMLTMAREYGTKASVKFVEQCAAAQVK